MADGFLSQYLGATVLRDASVPSKMAGVEGGALRTQGADGMRPFDTIITGGAPSGSVDNALSPCKVTSANNVTSGIGIGQGGTAGLFNVFDGPGNLYERDIVNNSASIVYAHFYDAPASAAPTLPLSNADTEARATIAMAANGGRLPERNWPMSFTSGCWVTFTTAYNNATAPAAGAVTGELGYKAEAE